MKLWNMIVDYITKVALKFWWNRETVCGSEVQKDTQNVTWTINVKLGFIHELTGMYTHNTL